MGTKRDIEAHIRILATLMAAGTLFASLGLLIGGFVLLPVVFLVPVSDLPSFGPLEAGLLGLGSLAIIFAVCNLALGLSAAYGLLKRRPWGRALGIIDNALSCLMFPFGTIFGLYGLWVLLPQDAVEYLEGDDPVFKRLS